MTGVLTITQTIFVKTMTTKRSAGVKTLRPISKSTAAAIACDIGQEGGKDEKVKLLKHLFVMSTTWLCASTL